MYIPGRFRTASRPSSLSILVASYRSVLAVSLGTLMIQTGLKNGAKSGCKKRLTRLDPQTPICIKKHPYFTTPKSIILKHLKCNILCSKPSAWHNILCFIRFSAHAWPSAWLSALNTCCFSGNSATKSCLSTDVSVQQWLPKKNTRI